MAEKTWCSCPLAQPCTCGLEAPVTSTVLTPSGIRVDEDDWAQREVGS